MPPSTSLTNIAQRHPPSFPPARVVDDQVVARSRLAAVTDKFQRLGPSFPRAQK